MAATVFSLTGPLRYLPDPNVRQQTRNAGACRNNSRGCKGEHCGAVWQHRRGARFRSVGVDNFNKAKKALSAGGVASSEGLLEQVELSNKPGALAQFADTLAKKGVNIDSIYAMAPKKLL